MRLFLETSSPTRFVLRKVHVFRCAFRGNHGISGGLAKLNVNLQPLFPHDVRLYLPPPLRVMFDKCECCLQERKLYLWHGLSDSGPVVMKVLPSGGSELQLILALQSPKFKGFGVIPVIDTG